MTGSTRVRQGPWRVRSLVLLAGLFCLPSCIKYSYSLTVYPDRSGKLEIKLNLRKDADPIRIFADAMQEKLSEVRLGSKNTQAITRLLNMALLKGTVEALEEDMDGFVAWKRPKVRKKGGSTVYDLVGYFDDINEVRLYADDEKKRYESFDLQKLEEDGGYVLEFVDKTAEEGFDRLAEDEEIDMDDWKEVKKFLSGLRIMHTIRMPGKVTEAEGMKTSLREAYVRVNLSDLQKMMEDPETMQKGRAGKIVCEPETNVDGEMKAYAKEREKVIREWEDLKKELEALDLPEIDEDD